MVLNVFFGTSATLEKHTNDVHNGQKKLEYASANTKSLSRNQLENIDQQGRPSPSELGSTSGLKVA